MNQIKALSAVLPESRKLRVMLLLLVGYMLNTHYQWFSPDQVETILMIVGAWIGAQGIADHGQQGKAIAKKRAGKGQNAELKGMMADITTILSALEQGNGTASKTKPDQSAETPEEEEPEEPTESEADKEA